MSVITTQAVGNMVTDAGTLNSRTFSGRTVIYSDENTITNANIIDVIERAKRVHDGNRNEIEYLYRYYKGLQPIKQRSNVVDKEIDNRIVENRALEIVEFKTGYLVGKPIQYVAKTDEAGASESIQRFNAYMDLENKAKRDKEVADWLHIAGTAFRAVLPNKTAGPDDSPFKIHTLDPRNTFVIYSSDIGNEPLMAVTYVEKDSEFDRKTVYTCYTKNMHFEVTNDKVTRSSVHVLGGIPIVEYPANLSRIGAFERVLDLMDANNLVGSDRINAIEQYVQAILVTKGINLEDKDWEDIRRLRGMALPAGESDAKYLANELDQNHVQLAHNHFYQAILTICSMPNRNGGTSTSDTGAAVTQRDGWVAADTAAEASEKEWLEPDARFKKIALNIMRIKGGPSLKLLDIETRFTRRNYENVQSKSQVLTTMLANPKIHPRLAFLHCGMFPDPELAYAESEIYAKERQEQELAELNSFRQKEIDDDRDKANDELKQKKVEEGQTTQLQEEVDA